MNIKHDQSTNINMCLLVKEMGLEGEKRLGEAHNSDVSVTTVTQEVNLGKILRYGQNQILMRRGMH